MAQYQFVFKSSNVARLWIQLGYIGSMLLSLASILVEAWLFVSALFLFAFSFDAERRKNIPFIKCCESGLALSESGESLQLCPPMIISPWLIAVRISNHDAASMDKPAAVKRAPVTWCRIWKDQLSATDWARIRRIGITLNAPLRRR